MGLKKGTKVKPKSWEEIAKTVEPFQDKTIDGYRHKETGLVYIPGEFIADVGKEFKIAGVDDDGDYMLQGSYNYYSKDWLERV